MKKLFFLLFIFSTGVQACIDALKPYPVECRLSDEYHILKNKLYERYGVNIEFLTGYRARRLIEKDVWENEQDRIRCRPEKAYLPGPDVWINWEKGANHLSSVLLKEKIQSEKAHIDEELLIDLNIQSVNEDIMGFMATQIKGAAPGRLRENYIEVPGFTFNCVGGKVTNKHIENVNNFDINDLNGQALVSAISHACPGSDAQQGVLSYTAAKNVRPELEALLGFIKDNLEKYESGTNDPDYPPMKFISEVQRWFVAIHPFGDGNGRTSRFLQDYLLAKFGLPYAPSGHLQEDVLLKKEEYQELFKEEIGFALNELKFCYDQMKELGVESDNLPCNCRPLYMDQGHTMPINFVIVDEPLVDCSGSSVPLGPEIVSDFEEFIFQMTFSLQGVDF